MGRFDLKLDPKSWIAVLALVMIAGSVSATELTDSRTIRRTFAPQHTGDATVLVVDNIFGSIRVDVLKLEPNHEKPADAIYPRDAGIDSLVCSFDAQSHNDRLVHARTFVDVYADTATAHISKIGLTCS